MAVIVEERLVVVIAIGQDRHAGVGCADAGELDLISVDRVECVAEVFAHGCCDVPESMIMAKCPEFAYLVELRSKGHSRRCATGIYLGDGKCICGKGEE